MFAIEYFCGAKFGGWHRGSERFDTRETVQQTINERKRHQARRDITPLLMRVSSC